MYSKYKFKKLVDKVSPEIIEVLSLKSRIIKWHFFNSNTKKPKKIGITNPKGAYGYTYRNRDGADIVIFVDKHHSKLQAIGTIIHELLHVRLGDLVDLVTIGAEKAGNIEERIVHRLEKLFLYYYK